MRAFIYKFTSLLVGITLTGSTGLGAERQVIDRIVAVIEDDIITLRELEEKSAEFLVELEEIQEPKKREERRVEILRDMLDLEIRDRMIDKEIKENEEKLSVTETDVDRAVDEVLKMNDLTRDQLQAALYGQGMSWSEYRKKIRKQIERARLIQFQVQGNIDIKEADVRRRCLEEKRRGRVDSDQRVCASHILLSVKPEDDSADEEILRNKATTLADQARAGADFAELASTHSADGGAPDGDLGCFGRGEMVKAFEEAAFEMSVGEISEPVRTQFGFHVIKLNSRELAESGCETEQELAPIQGRIYQEQLERKMNAWVDELRDESFVDVRL